MCACVYERDKETEKGPEADLHSLVAREMREGKCDEEGGGKRKTWFSCQPLQATVYRYSWHQDWGQGSPWISYVLFTKRLKCLISVCGALELSA